MCHLFGNSAQEVIDLCDETCGLDLGGYKRVTHPPDPQDFRSNRTTEFNRAAWGDPFSLTPELPHFRARRRQ